MSRKTITQPTIKKLYARSGNQCAFRGCTQELFPLDNTENHSNICHIEAAKEDGQRYNSDSNDEKRRSLDNLILLCATHHKTTDDVSQYTVQYMKKMKANHEREIAQKVIDRKPSMVLDAINALAEVEWDNRYSEDDQESFSIEEKINHNSVQAWKPIIEEYKVYESKIDSIYDQLEQSGQSFKKSKLLTMIRNIYLKVLGEYHSKNPQKTALETIQIFADSILDEVENRLLEIAKIKIKEDHVLIAMPIIMVDAFMRCKVLEKPPLEQ